MQPKNTQADRIRGCLLGGAIGDAMGGPFEGQSGPVEYREHSPWSVSDDTQLTLATCESIIAVGTASPEHIASSLCAWFRAGRVTGIGASTLEALRGLDAGGHWALVGAKGEMSAGNGAAMRVAPLAFCLDPWNNRHRQTFRDVCRITHHNDEAYVGGLAVVLAIQLAAFDELPAAEELLSKVGAELPDSLVRERIFEIASEPSGMSVAHMGKKHGCTGYVIESVPLALYAASSIDRIPLEAVLIASIEAGGDTDTIASIAGQVAGARIGTASIPGQIVHRLPNAEQIVRTADAFARTLFEI